MSANNEAAFPERTDEDNLREKRLHPATYVTADEHLVLMGKPTHQLHLYLRSERQDPDSKAVKMRMIVFYYGSAARFNE